MVTLSLCVADCPPEPAKFDIPNPSFLMLPADLSLNICRFVNPLSLNIPIARSAPMGRIPVPNAAGAAEWSRDWGASTVGTWQSFGGAGKFPPSDEQPSQIFRPRRRQIAFSDRVARPRLCLGLPFICLSLYDLIMEFRESSSRCMAHA
jgi:hypothetical protein